MKIKPLIQISTADITRRRYMKAAANEIIKAKRLKLGLSQKDLAAKAGVSPNTVYNVENAKGSQTLTTYKKICDALEIKVSSVLK